MIAETITLPVKQFISSLQLISTSYSLRCDAKYADSSFISLEEKIKKSGLFELGEFLPTPIIKGSQPVSLDQPTDDSVPVINTLSIQNLSIRESDCRHITRDDYDSLSEERKLRINDVLLTVDGGTSIGKTALFNFDTEFTVDSHVVILRPSRISPLALVYLLASPLGQMQFKRAESGASGQTTVTEDDIRRFIFPISILKDLEDVVTNAEIERKRIAQERKKLDNREKELWSQIGTLS